MVSGGGSKSKATNIPIFKYLPGQEKLAENLVGQFGDIFSGNMASPMARTMQTIVGEAGMREAAQERRRISETRGMSTPARQQAVGAAGEGAVKTMAGVPQTMWQTAAQYLSAYSMQAPAVGQLGKETSKSMQGGICESCYIMKALNKGELEENLRYFRDVHFASLSDIDYGYKAMAEWLIPLLAQSKVILRSGYFFMLKPLCGVADWVYKKNKVGFIYIPVAYFWVGFWKFYGRITKKKFEEKTPRLPLSYYPSMISTFVKRFKEVL